MNATPIVQRTTNIPYAHIPTEADPVATRSSGVTIPESVTQPPETRAPLETVGIPLTFEQKLGQRHNLQTLARELSELAKRLGPDASSAAIQTALKTTHMTIHPDSAYYGTAGASATLDAVIKHLNLLLPTNHFSLSRLSNDVNDRSLQHPLGNLGGALSWPVPLSQDEQRRLRLFTMSAGEADVNAPLVMQTNGLLLEFLRRRTPLSPEALKDPSSTLNALVNTPQAQLLGKQLQRNMQGIATDSSTLDYLLAAMSVQLDPESITSPDRNTVAGFKLADEQYAGRPASEVVEALSRHLVTQKKTSSELAGAAAYLLLASRAPVFLIKDIPSSVTYGSVAWVNLTIAAATIEAQTPGKVPNMTFAQVMLAAERAGQADPAVTQAAERNALIDWSVVNGLSENKSDDLFSIDTLNTLRSSFNARKSLMETATQALDEALPSRKEMALAELTKRFPHLQALFEEKLINMHRVRRTEEGKVLGLRPAEIGPFSLLDIAMQDLSADDVQFTSTDSRIPLAQLNADYKWGVAEAFESQFKGMITQKKNAVGVAIKHMISQLPIQDRHNFEYGKVTFYQGNPKREELLVRVEREGVPTSYEIDFNTGTIRTLNPDSTVPRPRGQIDAQIGTEVITHDGPPNIVELTPASGASHLSSERRAPGDSSLYSFTSERTQYIADAFLQHINLDNEAIRQQARGLTPIDGHRKTAESVKEFVLDLIPFRSAINHFIKGNIGDGLADLALDIFGFVTAGAATTGKLVKVGASALSTGAKALQAAKIIGSATIGAFNPTSGLGDLAAGGVNLLRSGGRTLWSRGTETVNLIRGATGSYDLLKAVSKEQGLALMGSFTHANRSIDTVAILKNDRWYHYDPIKKQPFGSPIADFKPLGSNRPRTLNASGQHTPYYEDLYNNIARARFSGNRVRYNDGYKNGRLRDIPDYREGMNTTELRGLASLPGRPPYEVGVLTRELKKSMLSDATYFSAVLKNDVSAPGVKVTPVSQEYFLAHADISSKGECAALADAMALAIHHDKDSTLMQNLYRAATNQNDPASAKFIQDLRALQSVVGTRSNFHMGMERKLGYQDIIDELTNFPMSTTLRIGSKDHAMLAGIKVKDGKTSWFFYEPNSGMVEFTTLRSMQEGMEKVLNSGGIASTLNAYGQKRGAREFTVSTFDPSDMATGNIDTPAVNQLFTTVL
ncbi:hypothetical protein PSH66_15160 [Pseudomonas sp. FP597]|uniref:hypothetical protein n=1 Tax=Pseudomonas sp. FP597 TaxID=2954096 RepID=UPI0027351F28|nr:hypothetical protein [Pseudomonas sp. FP597]WLI03961.1 hypothetical protein PSH66_15160 [Pseudomonas sp. FP597]